MKINITDFEDILRRLLVKEISYSPIVTLPCSATVISRKLVDEIMKNSTNISKRVNIRVYFTTFTLSRVGVDYYDRNTNIKYFSEVEPRLNPAISSEIILNIRTINMGIATPNEWNSLTRFNSHNFGDYLQGNC